MENIFGMRLKEARDDKNLSIYDLAELLGTTGATISRYENGIHEPKRNMVDKLSGILGVSPVWLMGMGVPKYIENKEIKDCKTIPILGTIAAGVPLFTQENIEGYEFVSANCDVDFCLRVKGDSMIGARIYNGDLVFIKKQSDVDNGDIAAILIDNESTLKRVYKRSGDLTLHAENPTIPDMVFTKKDCKQITILGKAKTIKFEAR